MTFDETASGSAKPSGGTGDGRIVNTQGGDYAGGNIDKRQGAFVENSTVIGDVIGQQVVHQAASLSPALHQLRAPVRDFVGREDEIDQLVAALSTTNGDAATIGGVRGMGGVGKTELAYVVANRVAPVFPDAQFLIELRGAGSTPLTPEQAPQTIIRVFEPEARLPDELGQLQALYRSLLTGRRVLILADDAKDAAQVRPLLPPRGCALLVTSRNRFSLPGMETLDLGTLPLAEAEKLLLSLCPRLGAHAAELAQLCGYLPLALRVSANLLDDNKSRDVAHYLEQLEAERLKHLADPENRDDPQASVEASLRLSYAALAPLAQSALCQISVFATNFDLEAAKAIVVVEGDIVEVLELLGRKSLLDWNEMSKRYSLHDLVRAFAAARLEEAEAVRLRHARHYAQVALRAEDELYLKDAVLAGLALFDQERSQIDAGWEWALAHAGEPEADTLLFDYANATANIGQVRYNPRYEHIPRLEAALAAALRQGRTVGWLLNNLGNAYLDIGDPSKAIEYHQQWLDLARAVGDRCGEGQSLNNLGNAYLDLGDAQKAIEHYQQWLAIARESGDRHGEGNALGNLGNAYAALGDAQKAVEFNQQWLVIARESGDRVGEGRALGNLGSAYTDLGDARQAIEYYQQCSQTFSEIGDRANLARTSCNLGLVLEQQGELARAIELIQVYADYLREIGHPEADQWAAYLEQLRLRP